MRGIGLISACPADISGPAFDRIFIVTAFDAHLLPPASFHKMVRVLPLSLHDGSI